MKKIYLIGASGQLGNELLIKLQNNYNINVADRNLIDLSQLDTLETNLDFSGYDIVINCAAFHNLKECEIHPLEALKCNVFAQEIIARQCKKFNSQYVSFSTDYVFNGQSSIPYSNISNASPLQVYGMTRLLGEKVILNQKLKRFTIIRTSGLFGLKESKTRGKNFLEKCIDQINKNGFVEVETENKFSPTYTVDLAEAIKTILISPEVNGIIHLTNLYSTSWYKFASYAADHINLKNKVIPVKRNFITGEMLRPKYTVLKHAYNLFPNLKMPSWKNAVDRYMKTRLYE